MMRTLCLLVTLGTVGSIGCGGARDPECGELSTLDLSDCDLDSVSMLDRDGTWNMYVVPGEGSPFLTHFSLIDGNRSLSGAPIVFENLEGNEFALGTHLTTYVDNRETLVRRTFAACHATDAHHFTGKALVCADGEVVDQGTFTAARMVRAPGEAEASGLEKVVQQSVKTGVPTNLTLHRPASSPEKTYALVTRAGTTGMLGIYDVSSPTAGTALTLVKDLTEAADTWEGALVKDNVLYVASVSDGVLIYDLTNPAQPQKQGNRPGTATSVFALAQDPLTPNLLFAVAPGPDGEVLIFDVTNPIDPVIASRFKAAGTDPAGGVYPLNLVAHGKRLYVNYNGLGLVIVDVANPAAPAELGRYTYPGQYSSATAVGEIGDRLVAFEAGQDWGAHLRAVDVSNPAAPALIGEFRMRPEISIDDIVLRGTKIYASYNQDGVRVIDVANPGDMKQVAYFNTWDGDNDRGHSALEGASSIAVDDRGFVYATDTARGLFVLRELPQP